MGKTFRRNDKYKFKPDGYVPVEQYVACGKKQAYETERVAWKSADEHMLLNNVKLRVYKCPHCKKYHLTSKVD